VRQLALIEPEEKKRTERVEMANKLFVGGLSWNTTDELLREAFSVHGEVVEAKVLTDRDTGRSRGFGFVTMASGDQMQAAIRELDGSMLDGRSIRVNEAQDRQGGGGGDRGGGGGRGGGFGGGGGGGRGGGGGGGRGGGGGGGGGRRY
jgi:cold-inducible RNA-binding protein